MVDSPPPPKKKYDQFLTDDLKLWLVTKNLVHIFSHKFSAHLEYHQKSNLLKNLLLISKTNYLDNY